ncbi:GNAT family N-acetyltransferase [Alkalihalobacillus sp. LMS6]|uniref:GNAT family N-acetyltransferase n=1 Tax=Alkalihalobacillus sp. LMS6 TaxID=2924034 RepID=UPI0020D1E1F9|nr:GNAT family N-acetyltransferase [Alkalihalobacillus sp. LMS6]UTR07104.1 GNAT family N-acetyltransferase [Alkalihalobacillus sp. LMS6]
MKLKGLTINDHEDVLQLFGDEKNHYLFIIDGMIRHEYKGNFTVYGEYEDNQLVSLLLNNYNNITYFANTDRDIGIFEPLLKRFSYSKLSGPKKFMGKFLPYVHAKETTLSYLGVVKEILTKEKRSNQVKAIQTVEEINKHYDLFSSANEYNETLLVDRDTYIQSELEKLNNGNGRTLYLEMDGRMVASCSTVAEDDQSAIVVGVLTSVDYRKRGLGTDVLCALFSALLREGKYPYLFYNNPAAKSVYEKIGMTGVCEWQVIIV